MRHILHCAIGAVLLCGFARAAEPAPAPPPHEPAPAKTVHYIVRVTSTDEGAIANITLRRGWLTAPVDLKADVRAFRNALKELAAKHKDERVRLTLEIGDKLLQAHVVSLIDISFRSGFEDISPVPIDKSKR
jgi:hypothetical protein